MASSRKVLGLVGSVGLHALLLAWTVRNESDLRRARQLADNIIFENVRPEPGYAPRR